MTSRHHFLTKSPAFTLVELMVVVAILGLLIALLLPAIQAARESSRGISCRNNLKEIGLAFANYETAHRELPKGAEGKLDLALFPASMFGFSWWVQVLPNLEQGAMIDQLDRTGANVGSPLLNTHNRTAADGFAPAIMFCPSSPVEKFVTVVKAQIAAPSYAAISGASNEDGFEELRVSKCCRSDGQISAGGVEVPNMVIHTKQIVDGLSKTLLAGEQSDFAYTQTGQLKHVGSAFASGWMTGTHTLYPPPSYEDWQSPSYNLSTIRYHLNDHNYDQPGIYEDTGANNPLLSAHPGIVNLLFCDGSVHGVADSLDVKVLKSAATRDNGSNEFEQ